MTGMDIVLLTVGALAGYYVVAHYLATKSAA